MRVLINEYSVVLKYKSTIEVGNSDFQKQHSITKTKNKNGERTDMLSSVIKFDSKTKGRKEEKGGKK